jgi:hypothetical protein
MRVISIESAIATQLVVPEEVRPAAGIDIAEAIRLVGERYAFLERPTLEDASNKGLVFRRGQLVARDRKIVINSLGIYNDGVTAETFATKDADIIIDDVLLWAKEVLRYRDPITKIKRKYDSSVVVEFDEDIDEHLKILVEIRKAMGDALQKAYGIPVAINLARIGFAADVRPSRDLPRSQFTIERRAEQPYSANRFFSVAPLGADEHIAVLETFERQMLGRSDTTRPGGPANKRPD